MATIEQIKATPRKTVVNGDEMVAAAKSEKVISFWERVSAYAKEVEAAQSRRS